MKISIPIILICLMVLLSCQTRYQTEDTLMYIKNKEAILPVWIRGNIDSGVFIVFNHGGPGDTSMFMHRFTTFQELEKRYAVVYWDQRTSGISQGSQPEEPYTAEIFAEDLDILVDFIRVEYNPSAVFMYGISWGGTLAAYYCSNPAYQNKITGLFLEGSGHNMPLLMQEQIQILLEYGNSQLQQNQDIEYWKSTIKFLTQDNNYASWTIEDYTKYRTIFNSNKTLIYSYTTDRLDDEFSGPDLEMIFLSPLSLAMLSNPAQLIPHFNILDFNFSPQMANIDIPVFLAWGIYDLNSPVELAYNARDSLGTDSEDIHLHIYENSGHNPSIDQPVLFQNDFISFMEQYK